MVPCFLLLFHTDEHVLDQEVEMGNEIHSDNCNEHEAYQVLCLDIGDVVREAEKKWKKQECARFIVLLNSLREWVFEWLKVEQKAKLEYCQFELNRELQPDIVIKVSGNEGKNDSTDYEEDWIEERVACQS